EITPIPGIRAVEAAGRGVDRGVAGDARRRHAVEGVCTRGDRVEQVVGLADAQQVARLVGGQLAADPADYAGQVLLLQRPADAVAVETAPVGVDDGGEPARGLP